MTSPPPALLISAYDATSHRRWREGLTSALADDFRWTQLTLPARHFAWRTRGNALAMLAPELRAQISATDWHTIIATSITDLVTLKGLFANLHAARSYLYVHENQFAYPWRGKGQQNALHIQLQFILNAASADHLVFNSEYNRASALAGASALLAKMPDHVPEHLMAELESKSIVLPVGISPSSFTLTRSDTPEDAPIALLWNHRWEYDKAPERAFDALSRLVDEGLGDRFELHVVGESFRKVPEAFEVAREKLDAQIQTWGYVDSRTTYEALLSRADIVISSALHEFQGLAMIEAMAAGARPVAPNRLAYPEYIPPECLYDSFTEDAEAEACAMAAHLRSLLEQTSRAAWREQRALHSARVKRYDWSDIGARWRALLTSPPRS